MTALHRPDDPMNIDEFETQLHHLVRAARDNEVAIEGAYDVRSPRADERDYQVGVTEIAKRFQSREFSAD